MRALGLISGTSADGVDAAVVRCAPQGDGLEVLPEWRGTMPYPDDLRERVLAAPTDADAREICALHAALGAAFGAAASRAIEAAGPVDLIASHGQTIYHLPDDDGRPGFARSTLQLGDPAFIVERTGVTCVSDFRAADVAAGGAGAPLVPYVDWLLLRSPEESRAALNIGGIANVTLLPKGASLDGVTAFDTGPGNALLDVAARLRGVGPFDRDGAIAVRGRVADGLLRRLQAHPYFARAAPKTTGRETFGLQYLAEQLAAVGEIDTPDLLATLAELTAWSIARSLPGGVARTIVSGGGVRNAAVMGAVRRLVATPVTPSDEFGLPADDKEAIAFAVLGVQSLRGRPANVPRATGAARQVVLGRVTFGRNVAHLYDALARQP